MIIHSPVPYLRKTIVLFGLVIVTVGAGISGWRWLTEPPGNVVLTNGTALTWVPCWFEVPLLKTMHCAYFYPPPDKKRGAVRLPVVVVRNRLFVHDDDPVLYIAGGPGGSSWLEKENIDFWPQWIERNDWPHDLVLYDQRGTGLSEPKASCPELIDTARRALAQNLTLEQEYAKAMATARRCHRRLSAEGGQLAMYSTDTNARDAHELMGALGHAQWNLYGVSYGSRVTMEVMRRYPEKIRSVVLDSVYPPSVDAILKWPALVNNALEGLFRQCRLDKDCSGLMPDPRASCACFNCCRRILLRSNSCQNFRQKIILPCSKDSRISTSSSGTLPHVCCDTGAGAAAGVGAALTTLDGSKFSTSSLTIRPRLPVPLGGVARGGVR